ncbi:MAG: caspase family protein [Oscillospiraceae bacterium]|jgi:hypothetical protein|nr:caspase family protein [Oscillospiraceae bacterium]
MAKKALVVGIDDYPSSSLSSCINDATNIASVLERNGDGSVNFAVQQLNNLETHGELRRYITECFAGDEEDSLFYFSGHGYIDSIGGYLVTPDFSQYEYGVSMQEILAIMNQSKCRNKTVILDCCHAGFMGNMSIADQETAVIKEGVTILTASRKDQFSYEGVFTSLLLDALNGGAADVTGHVTSGGIYAYIDKALGPWEQRPVFKTNVTRFAPLRTVAPQVDISTIRKIVEYFPDPQKDHRLNPSYEPTNSNKVKHEVVAPYANEENIAIFKDLQKLEGVGLVIPCDEEHMYFAAMKSKACRLTFAGQQYWRLVNDKIL